MSEPQPAVKAPRPATKAAPAPALGARVERLLGQRRGMAFLYVVFAAAYLGASSGRLPRHSPYNHYVYLADGWLHGRLALAGPPPNENDWAKVDVLHLRDGRTVRGTYGGRGGAADRFYPLRGNPFTIPSGDIASRDVLRYVSFPPFPAAVMLPFVALSGLNFNDVLFTALWAALNPVLLFLLLRDLVRRGYSKRKPLDDLWLTLLFGVGSVYYFCSVVGEVWFTAHVAAVTAVIGFAWAALDARRPVLAGLCVGVGLATRPPGLGLMAVFFLWEAIRVTGSVVTNAAGRHRFHPRRALIVALARFAAPVAAILVVVCALNWARFENPFEFGHRYLNVQWQERIQRFGLINYHFLSRNLAAALILLPRILTKWPYVKISQHGMSLLVTSPPLAYTVVPGDKSRLTAPLWLTVGLTALPTLLYQNSGYVQVGYRFSLDYMVFLVMLLAVRNRPLTRLFKALVVFSIAVNLFLAIIFDRYGEFMYSDSFFPHGFN